MKRLKEFTLPILALVFLASCSSVKVVTDYDKEADFNTYKTYAFYKTGIDKAEISDLDKKRILKAIDAEMAARGFAKSKQPDVLVSIFTKERERVDVYNNNFGFGWGGSDGEEDSTILGFSVPVLAGAVVLDQTFLRVRKVPCILMLLTAGKGNWFGKAAV